MPENRIDPLLCTIHPAYDVCSYCQGYGMVDGLHGPRDCPIAEATASCGQGTPEGGSPDVASGRSSGCASSSATAGAATGKVPTAEAKPTASTTSSPSETVAATTRPTSSPRARRATANGRCGRGDAGRFLTRPTRHRTVETFDEIVAVNLRAPFLLSSALLPTLRDRSGAVVSVSSVQAVATSSPVTVYAATKGVLEALTRALALEWAPEVRVNCVLPGAVESPLLSEGLGRARKTLEEFGASLAVGRVGSPAEIADAIVFLATNRYMTGASLIIDGGATARLSTE